MKALVPILGMTLVDLLGFMMLIPILPNSAEHGGGSPKLGAAIPT